MTTILFFIPNYSDFSGGGELSIVTFINKYSALGNQCYVVTSSNKKTKKNNSVNSTIIYIDEQEIGSNITKISKKINPDIIAVQGDWTASVLLQLRNINIAKLVFVIDNYHLNSEPLKRIFKLTYVDLFIANSQNTKKLISETYGRNSVVIYPLIDLDHYKTSQRRQKYITQINFNHLKGSEILMRIASRLPDHQFLTLRAWSTIRNNRKEQILPNLDLIGPVKDMKKIYSQTRLLLVPSIISEGFGRVIVEAQINGIPVIASNIGGIKETLGRGGILINDYMNISVWTKAILKFEDKTYYQHMSALAYENASKYSLEQEFSKLNVAINSVLDRRKSNSQALCLLIKQLFLRLQRFLILGMPKLLNYRID